jgi:putative ABC transport system permease protein
MRLRLPLMGRLRARRAARDPDRYSTRDLLIDAVHGIGARPGRLVMTAMGTVLGIASLVATIGFAQTAATQLSRQFDAVAATQVVVTPDTKRGAGGDERAVAPLPWDAATRVARLAGVDAAGLIAAITADVEVAAVPINDPTKAETLTPRLIAASPGLFDAVLSDVVTGRVFDAGHDERRDRVVVLGERAAEALGVSRVDAQPSVFIGDRAYTVLGIVGGMQRRTDLLDAVILPIGTARAELDLAAPDELQVDITIGAGDLVARQAPVALDPGAPENFSVQAPPTASELQQTVQADVNIVFVLLGVLALLGGGIGIANVTLLSVSERTGEIGLRRALGATGRIVARQFMVESAVVGLIGGLTGAAVGTIAVVIVAIVQGWTPVLDGFLVGGATVLGAVVGLVAGVYPAVRASRIEPVAALREGT